MSIRHIIFIAILFIAYSTKAQESATYINPETKYRAAVSLFNQQEFAAAEQIFSTILHQDYNHKLSKDFLIKDYSEYYNAVCAFMLRRNNAEELLLDFFESHDESSINFHRVKYYLGILHYEQKHYDNVIQFLADIDEQTLDKKELPICQFKLAYAYFVKKNFDKAITLFRVVKDIKNKYYYPANYYYGYLAYQNKDLEIALNSFFRISDSRKYSRIVPYYISNIYYSQKKYNKVIVYAGPHLAKGKAIQIFEIEHIVGKAYFELGDYKKAIPYINNFIENSEVFYKEDAYQLAYALYQNKNYDAAIKGFEKLQNQADSIGQNALYNLANCYLKFDQKEKAMNALAEAGKLNFDKDIQETAVYNYAKLANELGFQNKTIIAYQNFIDSFPRSVNSQAAKNELAELFMATRNFKDALEIIESIKDKGPSIRRAYQKVCYYRGVEYYNLGDFEQAITLFRKSLNNPINLTYQALAIYWQGEYYYSINNYKDAIFYFNKFISLSKLVTALPENASEAMALYNLGYCYYKQSTYNNALTYFEKANSKLAGSKTLTKVKNDAILRTADCYFMLKFYDKANTFYAKAIRMGAEGTDYALFQSAILNGLANNIDNKTKQLQQLLDKHPSSNYIDDALFELAATFTKSEDYDNAIKYLNRIINDYQTDIYYPKALVKLGLIYYNKNDANLALKYYQQAVRKFPGSASAQEALLSIKDIYISQGDANSYITFLESVPGAKVSLSAQDSLSYFAVESLFSEGKYDDAIKGFENYITEFPTGTFVSQANFYKSECLYKNKQYKEALSGYENVIKLGNDIFLEKALVKAADISYYELKDYKQSYDLYIQLRSRASYKDNVKKACRGAMLCAYNLNKYEEVKKYANQLMNLDYATQEDLIDANIYHAKASFKLKEYNTATEGFNNTIQLTNNQKSAEANYYLAKISFLNKDFKTTKERCLKIINQVPSYDTWVIKSFILVADVYTQAGELFQAKATLQSVIDNFKGEASLINEAKTSLKKVNKLEDEKNNITDDKEEQESNEMKFIEVDSLIVE